MRKTKVKLSPLIPKEETHTNAPPARWTSTEYYRLFDHYTNSAIAYLQIYLDFVRCV